MKTRRKRQRNVRTGSETVGIQCITAINHVWEKCQWKQWMISKKLCLSHRVKDSPVGPPENDEEMTEKQISAQSETVGVGSV